MTRCANKPLLWVLEELTTLRSLGGLAGPLHAADYFMCLVARLLQICPSVAIVRVMLEQDAHKYLRAAALLVARLIGPVELQREAMRLGWADYRKLCLYGTDPALEWAESTAAIAPSAASAARTLSASLMPLDHKRTRAEMEGATEADGSASGGALADSTDAPQPPRYVLLRMDEFTDYLFGVAPSPTAAKADEVAPNATVTAASVPNASSALPAHTFMGIHFPALFV